MQLCYTWGREWKQKKSRGTLEGREGEIKGKTRCPPGWARFTDSGGGQIDSEGETSPSHSKYLHIVEFTMKKCVFIWKGGVEWREVKGCNIIVISSSVGFLLKIKSLFLSVFHLCLARWQNTCRLSTLHRMLSRSFCLCENVFPGDAAKHSCHSASPSLTCRTAASEVSISSLLKWRQERDSTREQPKLEITRRAERRRKVHWKSHDIT